MTFLYSKLCSICGLYRNSRIPHIQTSSSNRVYRRRYSALITPRYKTAAVPPLYSYICIIHDFYDSRARWTHFRRTSSYIYILTFRAASARAKNLAWVIKGPGITRRPVKPEYLIGALYSSEEREREREEVCV